MKNIVVWVYRSQSADTPIVYDSTKTRDPTIWNGLGKAEYEALRDHSMGRFRQGRGPGGSSTADARAPGKWLSGVSAGDGFLREIILCLSGDGVAADTGCGDGAGAGVVPEAAP